MADLPVGAYRGGSLDCQIIYDTDDLPIGYTQRGKDSYFGRLVTDSTGKAVGIAGGDGAVASLDISPYLTPNDSSLAVSQSNRALIMSALATGRVVTIRGAGTDAVFVSSHVSVDSNQSIKTEGPTIKMRPGVSDFVIGTTSEDAAYSSVSVAWSAGNEATITWANHGCVHGDAVVLQGVIGTTYRKWFDVVRVQSVTDANTFKVTLEWTPTASPTGAMTAKKCVKNISVDVRVNHNYSGGNNGAGRTRMASVWSFVSDSTINVKADPDTAKYVALVAGAMNVQGSAVGLIETTSDTLKYYGPLRNVQMRAEGNSPTEDCFTIQPYEPPAFIAYMPCLGEINGVSVDRPSAITGGGSGAIVVYSDSQFGMSGLVIDKGIAASFGSTPGLHLRFGEGTPSTETIGDITVNGTQISSGNASTVRVQSFKARSLTFNGAKLQAPKDSTLRVIDLDSASLLRVLKFSDMDIDLGAWPSVTWQAVLLNGTVDLVEFVNCNIRGSSNLRLVFVNIGSSVREIRFTNCTATGIDSLVSVQTGALVATRIKFDGGYYNMPTLASSKISGVVVEVSANTVIDNATNGILRYDTAATSGVLVDHGASYLGTSVPFTGVNGGTVELRAPYTSVDISSTSQKRVMGSQCIASVAKGTIPAGHPVISDGTSWYSRITPSLTYT